MSVLQGRSVILASADAALRQRLRESLSGLRWQVMEAHGGAEAMAYLDQQPYGALLLDHWLPDLEVGELTTILCKLYPTLDVLRLDGEVVSCGGRSPWRHELLHAVREAQSERAPRIVASRETVEQKHEQHDEENLAAAVPQKPSTGIDGMVGGSTPMLDLAALIRVVAPHNATVLIEGETGTGKEIVARALHTLSLRANRAFAVLNCAAIPEALLEAELFGHTRGAFTGAVAARTGRIEAVHEGTLFLDEIGELPLPLQAKMLRFLECGELQRVGDNSTVHVDVRVIAATHQNLERRAAEGQFRLDLYHRLAVFPVEVPPLRHRKEDIAALSAHFLAEKSRGGQTKRLQPCALALLLNYDWPGNVRELSHVLERAVILAGDEPTIAFEHIRLRKMSRLEEPSEIAA